MAVARSTASSMPPLPHGPRATRPSARSSGVRRVPVDDRAEGARGAAQHRLAVEAHALLHQLAGEGGEELDGVAVDVDHRVVEPAPDLGGAHAAHVVTPSPDPSRRLMRAHQSVG